MLWKERKYKIQNTQAIFHVHPFLPFRIRQILWLCPPYWHHIFSLGHVQPTIIIAEHQSIFWTFFICSSNTGRKLISPVGNPSWHPSQHPQMHLGGSHRCQQHEWLANLLVTCRRSVVPCNGCLYGRSKHRWWHQVPAAAHWTDPEHKPLYEGDMTYFCTTSHSLI